MLTSVSEFYRDINPSTLSGAIDIVVVEDVASGDLTCSPFHVRFGKLQLLRPQEKVVEVTVNGQCIEDVAMKVGEAGEGFFVVRTEKSVQPEYRTSPLPEPLRSVQVSDLSLAAPAPKETLQNSATLALSDSELETKHTTDDIGCIKATAPLSDSEMDHIPEKNWKWDWGGLPEKQNREAEKIENFEDDTCHKEEKGDIEELNLDKKESVKDDSIKTLAKRASLNNTSIKPESSAAFKNNITNADFKEDFLEFCTLLESSVYLSNAFVFLNSNLNFVYSLYKISNPLFKDPLKVYNAVKSVLTVIEWDSFSALSAGDLNSIVFGFKRNEDIILLLGWRGMQAVLSIQIYGKLSSSILQEVPKPNAVSADTRGGWRQWWSRKKDLEPNPLEPNISVSPENPLMMRASSTPDLYIRENYAKSLRLSSSELKKLGLKPGMNTISFSAMTSRSGRASVQARIFLWRSDSQIVISDIDGTITKSDALGHLFTFVGKDWTHAGIAKLYSDIARNGYHFLYLTSRAIGQANSTRVYLRGIEQNKYQLPEGPVIMSPDRFFTAVRRELIEGNPEDFKIPCLRDIRRLFLPSNYSSNSVDLSKLANPFYAGFGNRHTDAQSYRAVGVPPTRIFTINSSGDLNLELLLSNYTSSYVGLTDLVDQIFPPRVFSRSQEPYTDYFYWKRTPFIQSLDTKWSQPPPQRQKLLRDLQLFEGTDSTSHLIVPIAPPNISEEETRTLSISSTNESDFYDEDEDIPAYPYV